MPSARIRVRVIVPSVVGEFEANSEQGPGHRFVVSDDLVLEQYEDLKPGQGLPKKRKGRLAGSHSGFVTTMRIAGPNDRLYPEDSFLFQYEGTYKFNTVAQHPTQDGSGHWFRGALRVLD